ncbi:hypothetical protein SNK04_014018 [Fusarium graminearum]
MYARVFENHAEGALILEDLVKKFHRPAQLSGGLMPSSTPSTARERAPSWITLSGSAT